MIRPSCFAKRTGKALGQQGCSRPGKQASAGEAMPSGAPDSLTQAVSRFSPCLLFLYPRLGTGMFGPMVAVPKVQISQINRQRQGGLQYSNGIVPVNREVEQREQRACCTAFPKSKRDHAFTRPLRCEPLNQKSEAENQAAGKAYDFPSIPGDPEKFGVGEKLGAKHGGKL